MEIDWNVTVVEASDIEARVQVRPIVRAAKTDEAGWTSAPSINGTLAGPYCNAAHTLPATMQLQQLQSAFGIVGEVLVPDPCFWTRELPYVYRLAVDVRCGDRIHCRHEQMIGLQPVPKVYGPVPR